MSENKTSGNNQKPSLEESGLEAGETTQGQTHDEDVADREEDLEDEAALSDEESDGDLPPFTEGALSIRNLNMTLSGVLTLHYPARDVRVIVDGDAAMRLLAMFRARSDEHWKDSVDPRWSSAASGWLVLDLPELLAMSYAPLERQRERTAIDPR